MSFAHDRDVIQTAFESRDRDVQLPPIASRIVEAREAAGLTTREAASLLGIGQDAYYDLEAYDDELLDVLDFGLLPTLAHLLHTSPWSILFGEDAPPPVAAITPVGVVEAIALKVAHSAGGIDALSEATGWDLAPLLQNPESIWSDFPASGVSDVCSAVGLDWVGLLIET